MTRSSFLSRARLALAALLLAGATLAGAAAATDEAPKLLGVDSPFAGMVEIPGGKCRIGVDWKYFRKMFWRGNKPVPPQLLGDRGRPIIEMLMSETPEHTVVLPPYAMERYEETNAQYRVFLDQCCRTSRFTSLKRDTLYAIAAEVYGENPVWWEMATLYWLNREKLEAKKREIFRSNAVRVKQLLEKFGVDSVDKVPVHERILAWAQFRLPENFALTVYTRQIPKTWRAWLSTGSEEEWKKIQSLPVEWVSGLDADAYAEWAGRHVPTEEEWEHAARGPKDWLYPWGNEWDCEKERNLIYWGGTDPQPKGPAPAYRDQPLPVDALPSSQSPFGCFHMLGNLTEWTSSPARKYPRSDSRYRWYDVPDGRVLRGHGWGAGMPFGKKEILIRNTSRILSGPGGPILAMNRFGAVGFRCAKYPTPALDVLMARLRRVRAGGLLPENLPFTWRNAFGVERNEYAPPGEEGPGKVFVRGRTRIIGVVPVSAVPHLTVKSLVSASQKEGTPPVIFAWLAWDPDFSLDILLPAVAEKAGPGPGEGGAEKEAGKPEAPGDAGSGGGKEGGKPPGEGKPDAGTPEVPGGEESAPEAPREVPKSIREENGVFVGLRKGRLAIFQPRLMGPKFLGYLPDLREDPSAPLVVKGIPRKIEQKGGGKKKISVLRSAGIDPAAGRVRIRLALPLKSKSTRNVFGVDLVLHFRGPLGRGWRTLPEGK